jgi:NADPH:quinone reductase-like Zn-dependent oxidoreductase
MRAVSLNYRDGLMVAGAYDPRQPLPLVPCSDGVGEVTEVGPGVTRVKIGDRVCPIFAAEWLGGVPTRERLRSTRGGPLPGTLTQEMVVAASGVVHAPDHLSDAEAACLPCAGVTAWSALFGQANVGPGDTVLILGTGGVSMFALDLALSAGARVIATSSKPDKLERLADLGVSGTVNYAQDPDWGKTVRTLAGGDGVDLVVEVGGAGTLPQSLRAVRIGGQVSLVGNVAGGSGELSVIPIFMGHVRVQGILVGSRDDFEALCRAVTAHRIHPRIDRIFAFDHAPDAFAHLRSGAHFGKVVIAVE